MYFYTWDSSIVAVEVRMYTQYFRMTVLRQIVEAVKVLMAITLNMFQSHKRDQRQICMQRHGTDAT